MGNPNQAYELPELPHHGDRAAQLWAMQAFSSVVLGAYSRAKWTESRVSSDLHVIPAPRQQQAQSVAERIINAEPLVVTQAAVAPENGGSQNPQSREEAAKWTGSHLTNVQVIPGPQRQPEQTAAQRIQQAAPYIAPQRVSEPYWSGSRAARASAAAYVPDRLSPEDEKRSLDETARLLADVDAYRAQVGMPVKQQAEAAPVAPVAVMETPIQQTPMQQIETQLPADGGAQLNFNGTPVTELRDRIGDLYDAAETETK